MVGCTSGTFSLPCSYLFLPWTWVCPCEVLWPRMLWPEWGRKQNSSKPSRDLVYSCLFPFSLSQHHHEKWTPSLASDISKKEWAKWSSIWDTPVKPRQEVYHSPSPPYTGTSHDQPSLSWPIDVWPLIRNWGTSLVVQWLTICLPMQAIRVPSLVQKDPTCCGATKPMCHSYWACILEPRNSNSWSPNALRDCALPHFFFIF